ncbi:MAG: TonB-dependent receptor, partial [Vicinamibacteraceae bacterium]
MVFRPRLLVFAVVLSTPLYGAPLGAQSTGGTISGLVRDRAGNVVPSATVTATNQATNASNTTTTTEDGSYTLSLRPGAYRITVSLQGFRTVTQVVEVGSGRSDEVDFLLELALTEAVTVTALKRDTTVFETPFSVAAPTEQVLRSRGVEGIEDVAANVGAFTVQNLGPGQSQVAMRGVSSGQIVRDQPGVREQVGVYLDESVISLSLFTPDLDLLDVNRVEVLRGPQGTLFGAGSLSGTVRYITNQPELGLTSGFVELGGSAVDGGDLGGNTKLVFNVPLHENAALRVASYYSRIPGYIDAVQPDLSVEDDVNDGFRTGVRAAVKITPDDRLSITPRIVYQKVDADGWNRIDDFNILANPFTTTRPAVTLSERQQFIQLQEGIDDEFILGDVNIVYDLGDVALTSITSYGHRDILVTRDATALTASITGGTIGLPEDVFTIDAPLFDATEANTFTEEVRLAGHTGRWQWVAGGFFSHQDRDYGQDLVVLGFEDLTGIPTSGLLAPRDSLFFSSLSYTLDQFALFGEVTVALTEAFSLTGGLRYYNFDEDKEQIFDGLFGNDDTGSSLVSQPGTTNSDGVVPRIIAAYELTHDVHLNAQASRGFRLGGINDPLNVPLCTAGDLVTFGGRDTWKDETVWNYEVGVKSRVLNRNGALSVSAFYTDVNDLQATVTAGSCSSRLIFNVPNARSQGVEVELEVAPNRHFDFALSGSFIDAELQSTLTSTDASGAVSVVSGIEEGRRLPTVPRFQLASAATYQWEVVPGSLAYVTGTYQHIGSRFTQVGDE